MTIDNKFNKIIAKRIKFLREKNNLTIEQLAYGAGISKGGLSEIERGYKEPRLYTIAKISTVLGIDVSEFFNYPEINNYSNKF